MACVNLKTPSLKNPISLKKSYTVTLDTSHFHTIFRYDTENDLLCVIPSFQRQSPSGDRFYLTLVSVLYVLYGKRVEKASRTGHAGAYAGYDAPQ